MKVVIVGSTHAGIAAVKQVLANYPEADITVYERQKQISYLACATYLHIEGTVRSLADTFYAEPDDFVKQGVKMAVQHDVISIDAQAHTLVVQNLLTKQKTTDSYDKLIMATGSITAIPAIVGIENTKVRLCKTFDQARDLCAAAADFQRVAIIGGGYIGVELAEGYVRTGHDVTLIQKPTRLLNGYLEPALSQTVEALLTGHGVHVLTNTRATRFANSADGALTITTTRGELTVDMAAVSAGMLPQTDLLTGQVKMAKNGAILTDDYMHSSNPDILAAGDNAVIHYNPTQTAAYSPLASHAVRQGALAGINVFERRVRTLGTQSSTGILIFGHTIACVGMTTAAAKAARFNVGSVRYQGSYRPDFMPEAYQVTIELIYNRNNRRILGAQLLSKHDISQSANTISTLIQNRATIDQLALVDMLFSPNFSQPFNYLNLAGQMAVAQENGYQRS
ncbi:MULTISPECIES: FAD-dependent oxidoreductase [Lactobacillaceae]|uniref:FAD-dependent oxidoreductase n=1 Tax=Lactobacillaceae TaxID=33958 RepID=UPI00145635BE|nr:FAD-dependent oxidoreductase [Lactobacillus sp. HBUAS51381]NLR10465.1 FAD-dependent oxidoreductase [Lactobacillus sp. HBUAS51381]